MKVFVCCRQISRPVAEYAKLHERTLANQLIVPLPAGDTGKSLPVPPELGGSLDGKSKVLLLFGFLNRLNKQACCCS